MIMSVVMDVLGTQDTVVLRGPKAPVFRGKFKPLKEPRRPLPRVMAEARRARRRLGMTTDYVHEISGVSLNTIVRMENGHNSPTLDNLERYLRALGLELQLVPIGGGAV